MAARAPLNDEQKAFIMALKKGKGKAKQYLKKLEETRGSGFVIDFLSNGNFFQILRSERDTAEHRDSSGKRKTPLQVKLEYHQYLSDLESVCAHYSAEAIQQKQAGLSNVVMIHHLKNITECHRLGESLGKIPEGNQMAGEKTKIKTIQASQTASKETVLAMMESADARLIDFYFDLLFPDKSNKEYRERMDIIDPLVDERRVEHTSMYPGVHGIAAGLIDTCTNLALKRAFEIGDVPLILKFRNLTQSEEAISSHLTETIRKRGELLEKPLPTEKDKAEINAKFKLITELVAALKVKQSYIFAAQDTKQSDLMDHFESIRSVKRDERFQAEIASHPFLASPKAAPKKTALQETFNLIKDHYEKLLKRTALPSERRDIMKEYRQVTAGLVLIKINQINHDEQERFIPRDPARRPSTEDMETLLEHEGLSDVSHTKAIETLDKAMKSGEGQERWLDLSAHQFKKFRDALDRCKDEFGVKQEIKRRMEPE